MAAIPPNELKASIDGSGVFPRRAHYMWAAILFMLLFVYGSFVPLEYRALGLSEAIEKFRRVRYLHLGLYSRADFVANLLLWVPIGYLWLAALDTDRRRRISLIIGLPCITAMLAAVIVGVEFAQLWFPRRTVSQNDMLAESVGAVLGVAGWFLVGRRMTGWFRRFFSQKTDATDWRVSLLHLYMVGLLIYMILPLDVVITPEELRRKIEGGRVSLVPFAVRYRNGFEMLWQMAMDVILYTPVGMGMRWGWVRQNQMRSLATGVLMTIGFAAVIETVQLFIFSRSVDATDVVTGGAGGLIGAWLVSQLWRQSCSPISRRGAAWRWGWGAVLGGLYTVGLLASFWYPFDWIQEPDLIHRKLKGFMDYPFKRYYWGQEFVTFVNLARGLMLFVPVGAILRWISGSQAGWRGRGWLVVMVVATMLGLAIEWGQAMTYTGVSDVTDVGVYVVGAGAGWATAGKWLKRHVCVGTN